MSEVSTPVNTTVIALDVVGAPLSGASHAGFETLAAAMRMMGFVAADAGNLSLSLTLAPDAAMADVLLQLNVALCDFDRLAGPAAGRGVVHRGTVFRADVAGQMGYVGSAIRSTQSILRRAPAAGGLYATKELAQHVVSLGVLPFTLQALNGASIDGLSRMNFAADSAASTPVSGANLSDPIIVGFLKKRLAQDVGPFAAPLVDRAILGSTAEAELIAWLSRNIDEALARARFENETRNFLRNYCPA